MVRMLQTLPEARVLIGLNKKNPGSDIGVNAKRSEK